MFTLPKLIKNGSARHQINIKGVKDNILILPKREYRVIIETSSINFMLMSRKEQDVIIDLYEAFLNSLSFPIQITQKVRAMDLDNYLASFERRLEKEQEEVYRRQLANYITYVRSLVNTNNIPSRQFYITLPYRGKPFERLKTVREQLANRLTVVENGLSNIGIESRLLDNLELLDLFYSSYNAADAKEQPLTQQTLDLLRSNYF